MFDPGGHQPRQATDVQWKTLQPFLEIPEMLAGEQGRGTDKRNLLAGSATEIGEGDGDEKEKDWIGEHFGPHYNNLHLNDGGHLVPISAPIRAERQRLLGGRSVRSGR